MKNATQPDPHTDLKTHHRLPYHLLRGMRPHHWIKNLVVFAAPMFAMQFDLHTALLATLAFLSFSFVSSGFYLINDIIDMDADSQHPLKRSRPVAAGLVSIPLALISALVCLAVSLLIGFTVQPLLGWGISAYAALQIGYNLKFKQIPIIDLMSISAGFVLRALAGAAATAVIPSSWFILCIGFLALYLAIEKRKAELKALGNRAATRLVLSRYSLPWLTRMENVITPCILVTYALWTIEGAQTPWMLATTPFVIYGLFKYQYLIEYGEGEAPEMTLLKSRALLATVGLWCLTTLLILLFLTKQ